MKAVWLDATLLALRWKATLASGMACKQRWMGGSLAFADRLDEVSRLASGAAQVIEALVKLFGALLRPGKGGAR